MKVDPLTFQLTQNIGTVLGYDHTLWTQGRFSEDIRRVMYTTNAIESVNMTLRKVTRNHRIFPTNQSVFKVVYLALQNISKKWTMPMHNWSYVLNRLMVEFDDRIQL